MMITSLLLIFGLTVLIIGADFFVKGASRIAMLFNISPLVIGLTVVAYGTSAPELGVSLKAAINLKADMAVGNVVGSNIFNTFAILGISSLFSPLTIRPQILKFDLPIMLIVSFALPLLSINGVIGRWEGFLLTCAALGYTFYSIKNGKKNQTNIDTSKSNKKDIIKSIVFLLLGLTGLVLGSQWTVDSASQIAAFLGISERVIGLTIVSAGTSFPELFTSVMAAYRNEKDIAIGNVIGSNIFNILFILGSSCLIAPKGLSISPEILKLDMIVMCASALLCLPFFITGRRISRREGLVFVLLYVTYLFYIIKF